MCDNSEAEIKGLEGALRLQTLFRYQAELEAARARRDYYGCKAEILYEEVKRREYESRTGIKWHKVPPDDADT